MDLLRPETGPIERKPLYDASGVVLAARRSLAYASNVGEAAHRVILSCIGMNSHDKWKMSSPEGQSWAVEMPLKARPRPLDRRRCTQGNLCKGAVDESHGGMLTRAS